MWRRAFRQTILVAATGLAGAAAFVASALAGAWTPDEGHGEIIVATFFDQASDAYDQTGRLVPTPLYRSLQANVYVAYGVTDWLTAIVRPGVQSSSLAAPADQHYTGLGDSEIAAQARVWRDDSTVVSVLAGARAPTNGGAANSWLQGPDRPEYDFRLLLGRNFSFYGLAGFADLSAGLRLVSGAPNEGHFDATLGLYVTPELLVLAQGFNTISGASNNPNTPQWAQAKGQLSLVYRVNADWRAQAGGFVTLAGRNAYRENGVLMGLWRNF
jgi:protein XagA